jgi:hypothetical protein
VTIGPATALARPAAAAPAAVSVITSTCLRAGAAGAGAMVDGRARTLTANPAAHACSASPASTGPRTSGTEIENPRPPGPLTPICMPAVTLARRTGLAVTWR